VTPEGWVLSADVGGTAVGVAVVSPQGEVRLAEEEPTRGAGAGSALETILSLLSGTAARAAGAGLPLAGCGIGVPGAVDVATGRIGGDIQNLPELAGCSLGALARTRTGLRTIVDNDVNALTVGEARFGVARGRRFVVLLAVGTGVGGGIYLDGELVRGASGYGGELGHVSASFGGRPCICGARGCLKAYVAGPDIAEQAREALGAYPGSTLAVIERRVGGGLTARDVFEAARAGDGLASELVERVCGVLGTALGGIMNALNPELIVLTGGVADSLAPHLGRVRHWARAQALRGAHDAADVLVVPRSKTSAVRGAAALFLHETVRGR
jgi:glucokinase